MKLKDIKKIIKLQNYIKLIDETLGSYLCKLYPDIDNSRFLENEIYNFDVINYRFLENKIYDLDWITQSRVRNAVNKVLKKRKKEMMFKIKSL